MRGYLLGAGSEYFGERRPVRGDLGLHGVHGIVMFCTIQNGKSLKVPVWGALREVKSSHDCGIILLQRWGGALVSYYLLFMAK